jgi:hypothetical protein
MRCQLAADIPHPGLGPFPDRPLLVELRSGMNASTDMIGVAGSIHAWNRVGAGLGVGIDPWLSPQFAGLLRVRALQGMTRRKHAMLIELACSQGRYRQVPSYEPCGGSEEDSRRWKVSENARWLQLDVSWETEARSGFTLRMGIGAAMLLNPSSFYCQDDACASPRRVVPAVTIATGWAF